MIEQNAEVTLYYRQKVPIRNIIASWRPGEKERILLFAPWDTRPLADQDPERRNEPIDGASGGWISYLRLTQPHGQRRPLCPTFLAP